MLREHPLRILKYSAGNIWLLAFPLTGDIYMSFGKGGIFSLLGSMPGNISAVLIILAVGFFTWQSSRIEIRDGILVHEKGILIKRKRIIACTDISIIKEGRTLFLRPFGAVRAEFFSAGGKVDVTLSEENYKRLLSGIVNEERKIAKKQSFVRTVLLTALLSSGFSGSLYIAFLFFRGGDILKGILSQSIEIIAAETQRLSGDILNSISSAVAGILAAGWILSFFRNLITYSGFSLSVGKKSIVSEYGILTRNRYTIMRHHILYTDIRRNLAALLTGKGTAAVVPDARRLKDLPIASLMNGGNKRAGCKPSAEFRPSRRSLWQYIWLPVILSTAVLPMGYMLLRGYLRYRELIGFLFAMAEIPLVWFIAIRTVSLFSGYIALYNDRIAVRYTRGFVFHTIIAEKGNIPQIKVSQSVFQMKSGRCNVTLTAKTGKAVHTLKGISCMDCSQVLNWLKEKSVRCEADASE